MVGYVDVVHGTKQIDKFPPPRGFHVEDAAEKAVCGLTVDTVFDLGDHRILPWSPHYFSTQSRRGPVGGRMTEAMQARLRAQALLLVR
ncbi:hypothetical protein SAMN05880582_10116 [Rhizobium sp. RU20A]|uniref:hypothetical protein n=1 Tax=Rhizobium sp. RU20A TaxID=1907412 RepID=UPI000955316A|nr:hypothetical protein [Rhizobium sp. RU20A]SIP91876.1 hypothetical protein SAMN05880582_10116 [Rhizobium sp. RU20A]